MVAALALMLALAPPGAAEPYIAVREGYKCSMCHVNMTGGGKRTDFTNIYAQTRLPQYFVPWNAILEGGEEIPSTGQSLFTARINPFFSFGGDLRVEYTQVNTPEEPITRNFSLAKGLLYLEMAMIPDQALFYLDQELSGAAATREFFMLFKGLSVDAYAKIGRFFLPSGLRLQDDTAYVRKVTGFNYGQQDTGFEVGIEPGPFSFSLAVTNGGFPEKKKVSGYGYAIGRAGLFGLSHSQEHLTEENLRKVSNVYGGLHFGRFTALLEVDRIEESEPRAEQEVALAELNLLVAKGANLKLTYEYFKPDLEQPALNQDRASIVYEPFVTQFLQVRLGARDNTGPREDHALNANRYFLEFHLFF